jgi:hypothetical protein
MLMFDPPTDQTWIVGMLSKMDQRSVVLDLHLKRLSAHVVHDALLSRLSSKAVTNNTGMRYLHRAKLSTADVTLDVQSDSRQNDDVHSIMLGALEERPLSSG